MSASTRSTRSSSTVTKRLLLAAALCIAGASTLPAQNIRNHYVSKAETDGVIYHTFPVTLFENREAGDLTFDITYKEHRGGRATINFTCRMAQAVPADSVRFAAEAAGFPQWGARAALRSYLFPAASAYSASVIKNPFYF